jgi:uncharacterized membrane protein
MMRPAVVAPSRDDPFVTAASQAVGGPVGRHARPHPFWTPLRLVLALVTLAGVLNLVHTAPCQAGAWWSGAAYADLCYSDVPLGYVPHGHAEGVAPYEDTGGRYARATEPAPVAAVAVAAAWVARALSGGGSTGAEVSARADVPVAELATQEAVQEEALAFYGVYALVMLVCALALGALLVGLSGRRPFDAAAFAVAPVLVASATVGWDLLGAALAVGAVYAWSRRRPVAYGVLLGTAVAAASWPVAVAVAMVALAVRGGRTRPVLGAVVGAASVWALWQLPVLLLAPEVWWGTVNRTLDGGIGYGSLWRLGSSFGLSISSGRLVALVVVALALVTVAVLGLALSAPAPRLPQVVLLLLVGGLLVWPVYSPQYVLWLLPFAVLARPRWRDLLWWQAGEICYFLAVWWTLSGATVDAGSADKPYTVAIVVRVVAELWLAGVVVRDILEPERDPARAEPASASAGSPRSAVGGLR